MTLTGKALEELQSEKLEDLLKSLQKEKTVHIHVKPNKFPRTGCDSDDVNDRKTMSSIICKQPSGVKCFHNAENWLEDSVWKESFILIVGQTQIGKTFILKRMLERLKDLGQHYSYVFYVSLKNVDCKHEQNFLQFLTKNTESLSWINWKCSDPKIDASGQKLYQKVLERIKTKEQDKVCIILDDFEKSNYSHSENWLNPSDKEKNFCEETAGYYIYRLLLDRYDLGKGKLLLLLNPWQFYGMKEAKKLHESHATIWVEGLDHIGQKNLISQEDSKCSKNNCPLGNECLGFVAKPHEVQDCSVCQYCLDDNCHHEIQSLCYVPHYCKLATTKSSAQRPSTVAVAASVLIRTVTDAFKDYSDGPNNCLFDRISDFAWRNYAKDKFVFDAVDLNSLTWREKNIFFSAKSDSKSCDPEEEDIELVFFFSHVFLQELLASLWLLSREPCDFLNIWKTHKDSFLNDGKFSVLFEFMTEICKPKTHPRLKKGRKSIYWELHDENKNLIKM